MCFQANERVEFQINGENLFDGDYFLDAHSNNNVSPRAPINGRFNARLKFLPVGFPFAGKTGE
ncbi:MAG: hypothetical protein EBR34_08355 [Sphingomonadaceae bacterium]|nr:hypothetical protein [Sphingomonadaceae bacterium]